MQTEKKENDALFVQWIEQYEKLVFSICYRMTRDYFEAEDLTQETFISVYKAMNQFDGANPAGFVTKIASNKCLDYLKKAERRMKPTQDDILIQNVSTVPPPDKGLLEEEIQDQVKNACNELKSPYAEVALKYYYEGETAAQIAEGTGTKLKTVQTQIRRARSMLQKRLKKEELL